MKNTFQITLSYIEADLGEAFQKYFGNEEHISIVNGDICVLEVDAIVSPANSFGFMDGGLDLALSNRFGWDVQKRLQSKIQSRPIKELLVGESITIETYDKRVPWIISAPTMRVPMRLRQTVNAYLATKAILAAAQHHKLNPPINHIAIPGLGTATGYLSAEVAAAQMRQAYDEIIGNKGEYPQNFEIAQKQHLKLNPEEINLWDSSNNHD